VFSEIEMDFSRLVYKWGVFCTLYEDNESVDLLNKSDGYVFRLLHQLIVDDIVLSLCRLTDRDKIGKNNNNSIDFYINNDCDGRGCLDDLEVARLREDIDVAMKKIKVIRNKRISHNDLDTSRGGGLPEVHYYDIKNAIDVVRKSLNKMFNTNSQYKACGCDDSGVFLLKILREWHYDNDRD